MSAKAFTGDELLAAVESGELRRERPLPSLAW